MLNGIIQVAMKGHQTITKVHTQRKREGNKLSLQNIKHKGSQQGGNKEQKTIKKMEAVSPSQSVIILKVDGLKSSIKIHRLSECIKKTGSNCALSTRDSV